MYRLVFLDKAVRELSAIALPERKLIKAKLLILAENPAALKNNIKRLGSEADDLFRLRVGSYRVLFKKDENNLVILVVRIGHRKNIYLSIR